MALQELKEDPDVSSFGEYDHMSVVKQIAKIGCLQGLPGTVDGLESLHVAVSWRRLTPRGSLVIYIHGFVNFNDTDKCYCNLVY